MARGLSMREATMTDEKDKSVDQIPDPPKKKPC